MGKYASEEARQADLQRAAENTAKLRAERAERVKAILLSIEAAEKRTRTARKFLAECKGRGTNSAKVWSAEVTLKAAFVELDKLRRELNREANRGGF
jgi:hypothetical protein